VKYRRWFALARSYRSREEILVDMLRAASGGAKKTHIMQRANLNPVMFRKYFPVLLNNEWVLEADGHDGDPVYRVSSEGRDVMKALTVIQDKIGDKVRAEPSYL
jgi:predicted transcriptional regulator